MSDSNKEYVQYFVVNEDLEMSPGKLAAQVAHAATTSTLHILLKDRQRQADFQAWLEQGQKKVVLRAGEAETKQLAEQGYLSIRDAGHTEIPAGSLTVVVLPPMVKDAAREFVGDFKLL